MTEGGPAEAFDRLQVTWGRRSEMTPHEAMLWHVSDRRALRAASIVVEILDVTPDWDRFVNGHLVGVGRVPRLRQRVVADPLKLGHPSWVDTLVDIEHHVRRVRLAPGGTTTEVLALAGAQHEEEFELDRPLWLATLVEGLPGGRAAYLLKFHHAMADEEAILLLFDLLHSRVRQPTSPKMSLPREIHEARAVARVTVEHLARLPYQVPRAAGAVTGAGLRAVRRPAATLRTAGGMVRAVAERPAGASPLLASRGAARAFDAIAVPIDPLREAAGRMGARLGEAATVIVLDALARYHAALGSPVQNLTIAVPLQRRSEVMGRRVTHVRIDVPTDSMPSAERVSLLRSRMDEAEQAVPADALRAGAAAVLSRVPSRILGPIIERRARSLALRAIAFRGLDRDAYLAGARVEQMYVFGPTENAAMCVSLLVHQGLCCLALNIDTAAVRDLAALRRVLRDAVAAELGPQALVDDAGAGGSGRSSRPTAPGGSPVSPDAGQV